MEKKFKSQYEEVLDQLVREGSIETFVIQPIPDNEPIFMDMTEDNSILPSDDDTILRDNE